MLTTTRGGVMYFTQIHINFIYNFGLRLSGYGQNPGPVIAGYNTGQGGL